jgi:hypothetical protein
MTTSTRNIHATRRTLYSTALLVVMLGMLVLHAAAASAGTIIYDAFNYPVGAGLNGQNGGTGFSGPWIATTDYTIAAGFLPVPGLASAGNHVSFTENNLATSEATRSVLYSGFGNDGTTTWLSFVMQADTDPTTGLFEFSIPNFFIGKTAANNQNLWAVSQGGNTTQYSSVPILAGVPVFVVAEFQFNSDPNGNDLATVFFNPTPGLLAPNVPGITVSENFSSAIGNIFLDGANGTAFSFDPLVFGDTYADVAPAIPGGPAVPEPASAVLLGTGLISAAGAIRRKLIG